MKIGLSSKTLSQMDMTVLAKWTVRPRLMAIPGVANVAIWGQRDRQFQVLVDPERLRAHRVTLDAVVAAAGQATAVGAGGFVDTPNQRLAVAPRRRRHPSRRIWPRSPWLSEAAPRSGSGTWPRGRGLSRAHRRRGHQRRSRPPPDRGEAALGEHPRGDASRRGGPGSLAPGPARRRGRLDHLPARHLHRDVAPQPAARDALGCLLVALILVAFLFEWRTALISLLAIPLSLLAAVLVLHYRGGTLNTMVLAGLVIALGEVVDDAIIDVENMLRRLRQNRAAAAQAPPSRSSSPPRSR